MKWELRNKVVVVTGSSKGIGFELVKIYLQQDCKVVLSSHNSKNLKIAEKTLNSLNFDKSNLLVVEADVTKLEDVKNLAEQTYKTYGRIDIWINNAGRGFDSRILDGNLNDFSYIIDLLQKSVIFGSQYAAKFMIRNEGKQKGLIVNISSVAAEMIQPGVTVYSACKKAVNIFSKGFAKELGVYGIYLMNIMPGITDTDFYKNTLGNQDLFKTKGKGTLMDLFPTQKPQTVAQVVLKFSKNPKTRLNVYTSKITQLGIIVSKLPIFRQLFDIYWLNRWKKKQKKHKIENKDLISTYNII